VICGNSGILAGPSVAPAGRLRFPLATTPVLSQAAPSTLPIRLTTSRPVRTRSGRRSSPVTIRPTLERRERSSTAAARRADVQPDGDGCHDQVPDDRELLAAECQDVVNPNEASDWTIENDTIGPNNPKGQASYDGYGLGVGDNDTVQYNCITGNSEGGFNASGGPGKLLTVLLSRTTRSA